MASRSLKVFLFGATFALVTCAFGGTDMPRVLIFQMMLPKNRGVDENLDIPDATAQIFQTSAVAVPITWSLTDPIFRKAVESGEIVKTTDTPTLDEAEAVATTLKCDYVMKEESFLENGRVYSRAEMYKDGLKVWYDPPPMSEAEIASLKNMVKAGKLSRMALDEAISERGFRVFQVTNKDGIDQTSTLQSVASTWKDKLVQAIWKGSGQASILPAPKIDPGQIYSLEQGIATLSKPPDEQQVLESVNAAKKSGRWDEAITLLRAAVDAAPFDAARREMLVQILKDHGFPELAAQQADLAAKMSPEKGFRADEAASALLAGDLDGAREAAMASLTRNPKDDQAMIVLGEVALRKQDFTGAVALFAQAISVTPSARAYGLSAIAKTFLADPTADADWATYLKTQTSPMRFRDVVADTEPATNALFIEFRDALPAIALRHGTTDPTATALKISSISTHLATLLKAIACEEVDHDSKERRVLALTLLSQSASEAVEYLGGQGEDFLTNSRIDLGEAMRQHDAANALMKTP